MMIVIMIKERNHLLLATDFLVMESKLQRTNNTGRRWIPRLKRTSLIGLDSEEKTCPISACTTNLPIMDITICKLTLKLFASVSALWSEERDRDRYREKSRKKESEKNEKKEIRQTERGREKERERERTAEWANERSVWVECREKERIVILYIGF